MTARLPRDLSAGHHDVELSLDWGSGAATAAQRLVVAPSSCLTVAETLGGRRTFGICANLYAIRSSSNDGVGNFTDLCDFARWSASQGATFIGINPLHATRNRGHDISPYSPISRIFRNDIYLDVSKVPELEHSAEARRLFSSELHRRNVADSRAADRVDYERIATFRRPVLRALHRTFVARHGTGTTRRGNAFRRYVTAGGETLDAFATFLALDDRLRSPDNPSGSFQRWPAEYHNPTSSGVAAFRREHSGDVDFHRFVQFELDRQLGAAAGAAHRAGMPIGLYADLAVASGGNGFDAWAHAALFARGADLGAPPDAFSDQGQNWGMPPVIPFRLRDDGYRYFIAVVRSAMAHAGALRIDHVMGLLRQFWIPAGCSGKEGAYVRFPADELFAILAVESRRSGTLVVGEDLGTVPRGFSALLARWGILSYRVMYFQRDRKGRYLPSTRYSKRALVTCTTHDHPPLESFWTGRDLDMRRQVGQIPTEPEYQGAVAERDREKSLLVDRLRREGVVGRADALASPAQRCRAVHAFLSRTESPLLGVTLDDLAGETEPVNIPGVPADRFAAWTRKMSEPIDKLMTSASVARGLEGVRDRRSRKRTGGRSQISVRSK
jgi:4-alpha-glucanotransferase